MSTLSFQTGPTLTQPHVQVQTQMQMPASNDDGPRKRRKRAPAAGAADDCFTCTNRNMKCDRRRPYCTQCLETKQDCAGYKTQLTWGVGVASRGKLRGLSLPVAGTKKVAESQQSKPKKRTSSIEQSTVQFKAPEEAVSTSPEAPRIDTSMKNVPASRQGQFEYHGSFQIQPRPIRRTQSHGAHTIASPRSTGIAMPPQVGWASPTDYSDHRFGNASMLSPMAFSAPSHGHYFDQSGRQGLFVSGPESYSSSSNLSALLSPTYSTQHDYSPFGPHAEAYDRFDSYPTPLSIFPQNFGNEIHPIKEEDIEEIPRDDPMMSESLSISSGPLLFDFNLAYSPFSGVNAVGNTPRMQYLIQYYAEVIAPVIVAFDGPTNPFKDQILTLASKSDSLQHALSALAASNLRQRRESGALSTGKTLPARRSSQAHLNLISNEAWIEHAQVMPRRDQKREEVYHKYHAVQSLNQALATPELRKDDSVLATLLVLCLFHICDSGIARFQTQFAGVKKLLTLRRNELGTGTAPHNNTKWMTRLFIWFDAMAATVNEREGQFDDQQLDLSALSDGEWSFETLAGVDGRLFKTMSRLGRLNILSQGKEVESVPTLVSRPPPFLGADINTFDGNGWMRIIDDEEFFNTQTNQHNGDGDISNINNIEHESDGKEQFWREWREVRTELQTWNMDALLYENPSSLPTPYQSLTDDQRIDVENISNAFRYSALLYTERLGNPRIQSSDEKIQYWVRRSLHHIKQVRSDVYLLWPLFITGSECVSEEGRNIIRERCLDIQKDSGFVNNASCLALLEKVWNVLPVTTMSLHSNSTVAGTTTGTGAGNEGRTQNDHNDEFGLEGLGAMRDQLLESNLNVSGFRFRDVMLAEGNEGEWIVV